MSYNFKKIADLELLNVKPDGASVVIEAEGAVKRLQADKVGVTSWNDLKDKPFGEEKAFEPIVWDGDISNPNYNADMKACKVSDVPLTKEELVGAKITVRSSDRGGNPIYTTGTIEADDVSENGGVIAIAKNLTSEIGETCIAIAASVLTETMGLAPGVYFGHSNGFYSVTVALDAETIKPLDAKYLPDNVATKADILGAMEASY